MSDSRTATSGASNNYGIANWDLTKTQDPSWKYQFTEDTALHWNLSYPYELLILVADGSGGYTTSADYGAFVLPISPQDMSTSMPFATVVSATLGGIVEENNGAPFRMIAFSGTTGVLPVRDTGDQIGSSSSIGTIFAGTMNAVNKVGSALNTLFSGAPQDNNVYDNSDFDNLTLGTMTGYYQFRLLQRFLESYAALKKSAAGRMLRLAFATWKDEAVYLVTPLQFDVRRSAGSPYEYTYTLSFKAWKRITLNGAPDGFESAGPSLRDPSTWSNILNKLSEARAVVQDMGDVIGGVSGDIDASLFTPLREVMYFAKDIGGVALAVADLPTSVIQDLVPVVAEATSFPNFLTDIGNSFAGLPSTVQDDLDALRSLGIDSNKSETGAGSLLYDDYNASGGNHMPYHPGLSALSGAHRAIPLFNNPNDHYQLFSAIQLGSLNIPPAVQRKIDTETTRIRTLQRLDFEQMRDSIQAFSAQFSEQVGAGGNTYNQTFGIQPTVNARIPTPDEWDCIFAMNDIVMQLNKMAASGNINQNASNSMDYIAGLAQASGIAFKVPTSKYAIPFPYGSTLEMVAAQYLNDPQRWMEIATLNGLQSPYVDEEGFDLPLTIDGRDNQIAVADVSSLYVNQSVWLSSNQTTRTKRHITAIQNITNNWTITVDGALDLDRFRTVDGAALHAYLPNTVNSQQMIYIPSDLPADAPDDKLKAVPGINVFDPLIEVAGIDLMLTSSGDLSITPDGDCQIAVGLTNIIQKIRVALGTPKGSLLHFPAYGLGITAGQSVADIDMATIKNSLQNLLAADPVFLGVMNPKISINGPTMQISFGVKIRGVDQVVPISVSSRLN